MCPVCRVGPWLSKMEVGTPLCHLSPSKFLNSLKSVLTSFGHSVGAMTLKCFRSGKATDLCLKGVSMAAVLRQGEWRSAAILAYVDEGMVEGRALVEQLEKCDDD